MNDDGQRKIWSTAFNKIVLVNLLVMRKRTVFIGILHVIKMPLVIMIIDIMPIP